jgi:hypothetical protein
MRELFYFLSGVFVVSLLIVISGLFLNGEIELAGDFIIRKNNDRERILVSGDGRSVPVKGSVEYYAFNNDYITGYAAGLSSWMVDPGFFIVYLGSGDVKCGLSYQAWCVEFEKNRWPKPWLTRVRR